MKRILELTSTEARAFLLKPESYANFDLPSYIDFEKIINDVSNSIGNQKLADIAEPDPARNNKPKRPSDFDNVNYVLLNNKDGKYAWRPFSLIHPVLYVLLVNEVTEAKNWGDLQARFRLFQANPKIVSLGIPIVSEGDQSDKAEQISSWWRNVEQESISLGLEFDYIAHTDISECYGSIYSHSIAWAIHDKGDAKKRRNDLDLLGNKIDRSLQAMSNGQTNGIPQGSTLMDFISEILLGYADLLLTEKIDGLGITNYKILRYRDDYRIFVNSPPDAEAILKAITDILIDLGLRLNPQKTFISDNVVRDSVKPDKLFWSSNGRVSKNLREQLQILHGLAERFPNSGTLRKLLTAYNERIKNLRSTPENLFAMAAIVIDIALKNPSAVSYCAAILSHFVLLMENEPDKAKVIVGIERKFDLIPNTGLLQLWLQRITLKTGLATNYSECLCKKVVDSTLVVWNSDWLKLDFRAIVDTTSIVSQEKLVKLGAVIEPSEVGLFVSFSYYE